MIMKTSMTVNQIMVKIICMDRHLSFMKSISKYLTLFGVEYNLSCFVIHTQEYVMIEN